MRVLFIGFTVFFACSALTAQLSITDIGTDYTIDFSTSIDGVTGPSPFDASGFAPAPTNGKLDSDAWLITGLSDSSLTSYGESHITGDFARGDATNPVSMGGVYFAELSPADRALMIQPSGADLTPGSIELRCINLTGRFINTIDLSYEIHVRNDESRSSEFNASIRTERMEDYTDITNGKISPTELVYFSDLDSTGTDFIQVDRSHSFSGVIVEPGEFFYILWETADITGSGPRDEIALDDIVINVQGTDSLTLYSQNSGEQTTTILTSTQSWSSVPAGNVQFLMYPLEKDANYHIQTGDTLIIGSNAAPFEMKDLIVESGAQVLGEFNGTNSTNQRYIDLFGDINCEGTIGLADGSIDGAGIGFDFKPGSHSIYGSGDFYCSRLRKDAETNLGICDLTIDMDITIHWENIGVVNNRPNQDGGSNLFNVTISSGSTVDVNGSISIDGNDPTSTINAHSAGGSIIVDGTLNINGRYFATTNNAHPANPLPVSMTVRNGGIVNVTEIVADSSSADGHSLIIQGGGRLNVTGADSWSNFSRWNNNVEFQSNSIIEYSYQGDQVIPDSLVYASLILSGSGNKTLTPNASGILNVKENLTIEGTAILEPSGQNIYLKGNWSNYGEAGFNETGVSVIYDNSLGTSSINCGDVERFDDLVITGDVILNSPVHVLNSLDLAARMDLNSNEITIENPVNTNVSSGVGYIVSEDVLHRGRITNIVNGYTGPVDFPFGTDSGTPIFCRTTLTSGSLDTISMATYPTDVNNLPWPSEPEPITNLESSFGLNPDNRQATAKRFWSIESDGTIFTVDLELSLDTTEVPTLAPYDDIPTLVAQRYQSSTDEWQLPFPSQSAILGGISPRTVTINIDDVDAFSVWAVASSSSPLPIELVSYDARAVKEGVQLDWTTASEVNNSHFELRRFSDSGEETWLGDIDGSGYSTSQLDYEFLDKSPTEGWNYYRLLQHDFDGTVNDKGVVSVLWEGFDDADQVFTYWSDGLLNVRVSSELVDSELHLFDSSGRNILGVRMNSTLMEIPFSQSEGIYILRIQKDNSLITKKIGH